MVITNRLSIMVRKGRSFDLAIPSPEHYLPLFYALALKAESNDVTLFNDKAVAGSLTMTSVKITKTKWNGDWSLEGGQTCA